MSKSLVKLVDYSLLPAALMVIGKFVGLWLSIQLFSLEWGIKNIPNSLFSVVPEFYAEDIHLASTYSDLIMFLILVIGFSIILVQALYLHNSHIAPTTLVKLATNNLLGLVKSSFEIYHRAAIWSVFIWISNILIFINVLLNRTDLWVLIFSLIISIVITTALLRDAFKEIELSKKKLTIRYDQND